MLTLSSMIRFFLASAMVLLSMAVIPPESHAAVLPEARLNQIHDNLKKQADDLLKAAPKTPKECRQKAKKMKKLIRKLTKLKRKIRDRTTKLRQDPNFNATTPEIIRLQNRIKEINDLRKDLRKQLKAQRKKQCPAVAAVAIPAVQALGNQAQGLINQGLALINVIGNNPNLSDEDKDEIHTGLNDLSGELEAALTLIQSLLNDLYGSESTPELDASILLLQELKTGVEEAIEQVQYGLEETRTDEVAEEGDGAWIELCPVAGPIGQGITFTPCSELE